MRVVADTDLARRRNSGFAVQFDRWQVTDRGREVMEAKRYVFESLSIAVISFLLLALLLVTLKTI